MNLKEGTRRLALLLGVVGAILGGFASYMELQTVMRERAGHKRFEQLASSDVVRHEYKFVQSGWFTTDSQPNPSCNDDCSVVHMDGIKAIHWTKNLGVESFEMEDGQTLYPTPEPGACTYVLIAILPILGFFIPWGAVRSIGWVGAGFVADTK